MINWLHHIAIVVPNLTQAAAHYKSLGVTASEPKDLPEHGVTVVFVTLPNAKIELLCPFGEGSPIASFLEKNPAGGIHHLCLEVEDIQDVTVRLTEMGTRVLGDGRPKIGAHDKPVIFAHPKDFHGALVEFEQN